MSWPVIVFVWLIAMLVAVNFLPIDPAWRNLTNVIIVLAALVFLLRVLRLLPSG